MRSILSSLGLTAVLFSSVVALVPAVRVFADNGGGGPSQRYTCPATSSPCAGKTCPPNQGSCGVQMGTNTCNCLM